MSPSRQEQTFDLMPRMAPQRRKRPWILCLAKVRLVSLARLDETPKAAFPSVLFRQLSSIDLMRIHRICGTFIRRERIEFCKIPSRMAIGGRSSAIEDIVEKGAE